MATIGHQTVTRLNPPTLPDSTALGYSQISVVHGGALAVLSGQVASSDGDAPLSPDVGEQARSIARLLKLALESLNATPADIVSLRIHVVHGTTDRFMAAWKALKAMLGDEQPSVTVLGVTALFTPEIQVEVEMTVRLPG